VPGEEGVEPFQVQGEVQEDVPRAQEEEVVAARVDAVDDMKSSCFLPLSRGSYSLGLSDRRLARRVLLLEGRLRKDFL
jgi:hypothetical protein